MNVGGDLNVLSLGGVLQGMGEPLNNYNALVEAIRVMTGLPFQLSPRRITVSTVGIAKCGYVYFYLCFL